MCTIVHTVDARVHGCVHKIKFMSGQEFQICKSRSSDACIKYADALFVHAYKFARPGDRQYVPAKINNTARTSAASQERCQRASCMNLCLRYDRQACSANPNRHNVDLSHVEHLPDYGPLLQLARLSVVPRIRTVPSGRDSWRCGATSASSNAL